MSYAREIEAALKDGFLRRTLDKFAVEYRAGRDRAFAEVDARALISAAAHYTPTPEEESCCGFGGSWSMKFPTISKELMHKKLDNACSGDATHLALDCPGCTIQLRGGADREKRNIQVVHVAEVLAAALPPS